MLNLNQKNGKRLLGGLLVAVVASPALALDTSEPFLCAVTQVYECIDGTGCASVLPEAVGAPTFLRVNVKKKQLRVSPDRPPSKIISVSEVEGRIILLGAEDGRKERPDGSGWVFSIEHDTGRFVAAVAVLQGSITLFGACTEPLTD